MTSRTYQGSCRCGAVTFEADVDLSKGTTKCNCSLCWKQRMWRVAPGPDGFRLKSGEASLGDFSKSGDWGEGHHRFCSTCGVVTHSHGVIEAMGGPFLTVQVSTFDDMPIEDLIAAPVTYMNGRDDDWGHAPAETRHL